MAFDISTVSAVMDQKIIQLDNVTNNIANAQTSGFKAQHLHLLKSIDEGNRLNASDAVTSNTFVDFSQGILQKTDNPLDLSLQDDGFFVVQTKEGMAFTRRGDLAVNKLNQLVTQAGEPVLGESGPITLKSGKIQISPDGAVFVDESQMGKLKIVDFSNRQALTHTQDGYYRDPGTAGMKIIGKPQLISGSIELSNVNVIREMAEMIDVNRSFETYQKIIQTLSEQDKLAIGRVGRIA